MGRDEELSALCAGLAAVAAGRGGVAWLEGEPGIGKSSLITSVLADGRARHCQTYRAVGDELGQRLPLRALTDALGPRLTAGTGALLDADTGSDSEMAAPAAVERFLALVDRLCAAGPVVFVLDDLQWADEASLLAWHRLSLAVDQIPLLLSRRTIQTHVSHILTKLGYNSRIEIAREADRRTAARLGD